MLPLKDILSFLWSPSWSSLKNVNIFALFQFLISSCPRSRKCFQQIFLSPDKLICVSIDCEVRGFLLSINCTLFSSNDRSHSILVCDLNTFREKTRIKYGCETSGFSNAWVNNLKRKSKSTNKSKILNILELNKIIYSILPSLCQLWCHVTILINPSGCHIQLASFNYSCRLYNNYQLWK